jgi:hypothetical protein
MQTETEDRYADLEKPIEDVREMAQVVAQMAAHVGLEPVPFRSLPPGRAR